jgi:hypothetical protein
MHKIYYELRKKILKVEGIYSQKWYYDTTKTLWSYFLIVQAKSYKKFTSVIYECL